MTRRADHEGPVHRAVLQYLRHVLPDAVVYHPPSETRRPGVAGDRERAMNSAMGVLPGYPDIVVHLPGQTVFVEVKAPGGSLSAAQKVMHEKLRGFGNRVAVVRSIDEARAALVRWGVVTREAAE